MKGWWGKDLVKFLFFSLITFTSIATIDAQTVLYDNFQRSDNNTVGVNWLETQTAAPGSATLLSNQLRLGGTTAGRDYILADVSAQYNTVFNSNTSSLTWMFNMRSTRTDPSGFDAGNYGIAFILGCSTNNALSGSGYAVVHGNSGTSDNLRLVKFAGGLISNAGITSVIAPIIDYGTDYLTVKVTYNPIGNNWSLFVGTNLAAFVDPTLATYTQLGATTSDNTYTGTDLLYMGCLWNHNTGATDFGYFDNINVPSLCSLSPEPTIQATNVTASSIGANSLTLNWTRGNGTECIVVVRQGAAVTATPVDGSSYPAVAVYGSGTALGVGQFAIYTGSANSITVSGLSATTNYFFSVYEYNGSSCTVNYLLPSAPSLSVTTIACVITSEPLVAPSALTASNVLSNSLDLTWVRGSGNYCIVVAKEAGALVSSPLDGSSYAASSTFGVGAITAPGEFVVYAGNSNSVAITGLQAGTAYYFSVYEFNGTGCISNYLLSPSLTNSTTLPAVTYNYYFGNLHSHSDYSDGDMDNVCNGVSSATCCYDIGNTALNFNYMGLSDHNHNEGPVMSLAKYASGIAEATAYNSSHSDFVALYGMEWGTISTGGHCNVYGIDQLVGWNAGNYSIYNAKGNYAALFNLIAATPNAFATLNHPNSGDFGNLQGSAYNAIYDNAIVGVALRNGPYNSTSISYNDPSTSNYISFYHSLLAKGYHLGPMADLDNHNSATMGKSSQQRTVLLATSLTKAAIIDAVLNMRFYASDDYNAQVSYKINGSINMGSITTQYSNPTIAVSASDPDGDAISSIKIYYGIPGSGANPTVLTSVNNAASLNYTHSFGSGTYYYYAEITESDGNIMWTAPIWYTKNISLPIRLLSFTGSRSEEIKRLIWITSSEVNNQFYTIERSTDATNFSEVGIIAGAGYSTSIRNYEFEDATSRGNYNYYRLKQTDFDGRSSYSNLVLIRSQSGNEAKLYPNPAKGNLSIDMQKIETPGVVQIMGIDGKILLRERLQALQVNEISLDKLTSGIYLVELKTDLFTSTQKLVIEKGE